MRKEIKHDADIMSYYPSISIKHYVDARFINMLHNQRDSLSDNYFKFNADKHLINALRNIKRSHYGVLEPNKGLLYYAHKQQLLYTKIKIKWRLENVHKSKRYKKYKEAKPYETKSKME